VAVYHPHWRRGHRRVVHVVDGVARIPGRFALDWVKTDEKGSIAQGDADVARNHFGYGSDVIAVADAIVVAARDGMAESTTVSGNRKHALKDASGNFIALKLAAGPYAFYEHLHPGSVRVVAGDVVRSGQILASLGFTGDSTGPHLHFHLADGPSAIEAEGVPFLIDQFTLLGRYADIAVLGWQRWTAPTAGLDPARKNERPSPNAVVRFAN
jgi:murein DD-endopeptidase MepM/ murein hydrolase activator NlpD